MSRTFFLGVCIAAGLLALARLAALPPAPPFDPAQHAFHWTSTRTLQEDVDRLASGEFDGRSEENGGAGRAAGWILQRFRSLGLETSFRHFEIVRRELEAGCALRAGSADAAAGEDWLPLTWGAAGDASGTATPGLADRISGNRRGLEGRVAVEALDPAPGMMRTLEPPLAERARRYEELGAKAVIFVAAASDPEAGGEAAWPSHLPAHSQRRLAGLQGEQRAWMQRRVATGVQARAPRPARPLRIPAVLLSSRAAQRLAGPQGWEGLPVSVSVRWRETRTPGVNVFAELPGSSADERRLLVCAHYDSHGIDPLGRMWPGACDNASGVAVLLAVAEAFVRAPRPPARGVLFAAFGGEELGLWGSDAFAAHDVRVPGRILAAINVDMAGRGREDEAWLVGAAHSPRLAELLEIGLGRAGVGVKKNIDFTFPHGSDHWPLHRAGVPAVLVTCSRFPEQDQPGDAPGLVDAGKMLRLAAGVFSAAWRLADSPETLPRPRDVRVKFPGER